MNARADELRQQGFRLINLGQAVPFYPPPTAAQEVVRRALTDPPTHRYTLDPGLPALRVAWAKTLKDRFKIPVNPETELLITAGANSAFLMTVMALISPGDRVALLTPWYFNHDMAITMAGGVAVPIALDAAQGFQLDVERILRTLAAQHIRVLVVVSPNNPTGATYEEQALATLARGCLDAGITLICDETYAFFPNPGMFHYSPASLEERPQQIITIGSFSKTFAMTGWRVGYVVAPAALREQMLKIQDTMFICAPHPGQILAQACIESAWIWLDDRKNELAARRQRFLEAADRLSPWEIKSAGLFFGWLEGPHAGRETALRLLADAKIILIPGDIFGPGLENTLRVSLGCCSESEYVEGLEKLVLTLPRVRKTPGSGNPAFVNTPLGRT